MGSISYFLGLEASLTPDGLFISRLKYARDILTHAQLLDSKPVHTPMVVSQHLLMVLLSLILLSRSLVGILQYLTITRINIVYAVYSVSRFLHVSTADRFLAVKRILRYVKGTLHFGLTFRPSTVPSTLVTYSDADWAGCLDTRRSTSGYSIYLSNNLVSWSAKKQLTVSRSSCESEYRLLLPRLLLNFFGLRIFCMASRSLFHSSLYSYVTTKVLFFFIVLIPFLTSGPNMLN